MELPEVVSGEKYSLKWNRHHNIIASNIFDHLSEEELVDVTLSCEGRFIKAHKLILSASSQFFKELFQRHKEKNPIIIMTNIRFEYLKYIIDYIYKGEIKLLSSEIQGILNLANELQIKGLYGILNKSFQHLSELRQNIQNTKADDKWNIKSEECQGKTSDETKKHNTTSSSSPNITMDSVEPNRTKHSGTTLVKKREADSLMKQERNKKRKKSPTEHVEPQLSMDTSVPPLIVLNLKETFGTPEIKPNDITTQNVTKPSKMSLQMVANLPDPPNGISQEPETKELLPIKSEFEPKKPIDTLKTMESTPKAITLKQISAFMLFTDEYRPILSKEYPDESVKEISLRLSSLWKNLPIEKKDSFYEEASKKNEKLRQRMNI